MNTSNQKLRVCELFAGIGGFRLGIEQALGKENVEFVYVSEWDKYAAQIYNKNFEKAQSQRDTRPQPDSSLSDGESRTLWGSKPTFSVDTRDIRTVPTSEIPDHDLLVGGFPCQAFSIAGKRRGFDDTRGTMFFEIARILKVKKPRLFILENVKGLLSHNNGGTFKTIISTLTELGYDLQWQVLNSKNFGVPQNRERVFIVGHIRGTSRPEVFPISASGGQTNELQGLQTGAITARRGTAKSDGDYIVESNRKAQEIKVVGTLETDGWEKRHEQIRRVHGIDGISPTIPTGTGGGVMTKVAVPYVRNPYNGKQSETETGTIGTSVGTSTGKTAQLLHKDLRIRRLTPTECERLQGFPDGWTEGISDTQRYKCLGNAVTTNVITVIGERLTNKK